MGEKMFRPTPRITDRLHPGVYVIIVGLALWFVLSAWAFGGDSHTDYLLVVSGLFGIAIAIPAGLWRIWRSHPHKEAPHESLREWASASEFRTWQDRVKAKNAAIEILLPIAAVAFGLSIFAVIVHFTAH